MKQFSSRWFTLIGFVLLLSGFLYGGIFLGVPYPDPTPELQEKWDFHWKVTRTIYLAGMVMVTCGIAIAVSKRMSRAD